MSAIDWSEEGPRQAATGVRYTGIALRSIAFAVDLLLWAGVWSMLLLGPTRTIGPPWLGLMLIAGPLLYFPIAWGAFSTTLGMRTLRLRIVRATDGARIGAGAALLRYAVFLVLVALSVAIVGLLLLALPMVLDERRRGIHDRLADAVVIRPASGWSVAVPRLSRRLAGTIGMSG